MTDVEHLFICLLSIYWYLLWWNVFRSFACFFIWVFFSFYWILIFLYRFWICLFSYVWFGNTFTQLCFVFSFFQQFYILMEYNLSDFSSWITLLMVYPRNLSVLKGHKNNHLFLPEVFISIRLYSWIVHLWLIFVYIARCLPKFLSLKHVYQYMQLFRQDLSKRLSFWYGVIFALLLKRN